jgi:hypothetical protein
MRRRRFLLVLAPVLALLASGGCSADRRPSGAPKVVRVTGRVLFNGQPLADAHVTFTNPAANRSAYAKTDADGKFALTTFGPRDGAVPGTQLISVSKVEVLNKADPAVDRTTTTTPSIAPERRWFIPSHYADVTTSGLTAEVSEEGTNEILVELTGTAEK